MSYLRVFNFHNSLAFIRILHFENLKFLIEIIHYFVKQRCLAVMSMIRFGVNGVFIMINNSNSQTQLIILKCYNLFLVLSFYLKNSLHYTLFITFTRIIQDYWRSERTSVCKDGLFSDLFPSKLDPSHTWQNLHHQ